MALYRYERLQPEYSQLWAAMRVDKVSQAISEARHVIANKTRYQAVEATTGVPWFVIGCLHMREAAANFAGWLHNGDPMHRAGVPARTVHVPRDRPPNPSVSWEEGGYDALVTCERLNEIKDWCPERVAYAAELYNGFGYRNPTRNIPSPYLWGGTSVQKRGKFVADGKYDASEMDPQLGAMAVLKTIMEIDPDAHFANPVPVPEPAPTPVPLPAPVQPPADVPPLPAPRSPRADDTETEVKPLHKSRTMWGGIGGIMTTVISTVVGFFDKLDNPYTLTGFIALLGFAGVSGWLVISGRVNVQKVLAHLSLDDTDDA